MAEGYNSNQFYNFSKYEIGSSVIRKKDDNPNFAYPGPLMDNVFDAPSVTEKRTDTSMQRGFIRGIYPSALANVKKKSYSSATMTQRRLFFQFNPATLDRTVQMSTSVLNPLLQDPTNLLQPVPGTSDFSFELLFNREFEVFNSAYKNNSNGTVSVSQLTKDLKDYGGSNYRQSDVASLGVLADLYVLDAIIGQSITKDMVEFLKDYWNNASTLSQSSFQPNTGGSSFSFDSTGFETTVTKNLGNAAFLSPLPVRIVFSSLFMVEGFVTLSSVQFIKFTKNYVPTVAKVSLNIRALYMGFARERAYLTDALETAVADLADQKNQDIAKTSKMQLLAKYGTYFVYNFPKGFRKSPSKTDRVASGSTTPIGSGFDSFYNQNRNDYWFIWGEVRSWVSPELKAAVEANECTWSFTSKFSLTEIGPDGEDVAVSLIDQPIVYVRHNNEGGTSDGIQNTEIASNANKVQTEKESRINWYRAAWGDLAQLKDKMMYTNSKIRLDITHTVTVSYTLSSGGDQTVSSDTTQSKTFSSPSDWDSFIGGTGQIRMITKTPTGGGGAYKS